MASSTGIESETSPWSLRLPLASEPLRLRDLRRVHHRGDGVAIPDGFLALFSLRCREARSGQIEPLVRLDVVLRYAHAEVVHIPENELGVGAALVGGFAVPLH